MSDSTIIFRDIVKNVVKSSHEIYYNCIGYIVNVYLFPKKTEHGCIFQISKCHAHIPNILSILTPTSEKYIVVDITFYFVSLFERCSIPRSWNFNQFHRHSLLVHSARLTYLTRFAMVHWSIKTLYNFDWTKVYIFILTVAISVWTWAFVHLSLWTIRTTGSRSSLQWTIVQTYSWGESTEWHKSSISWYHFWGYTRH